MSRSLFLSVCILQIAILVQCHSGLYSIVAPGTLRSKSTYHVTVALHDASTTSKIKVGLIGPQYQDSQTVEIAPHSSKLIQFTVPKLKDGDYNLTAQGISGIEFQNTTKLNYAGDQLGVYVQTDKATYKPGDKVQFRVLILDENTRPAKFDGPVDVVINDAATNRIKQWNDVKLTKGVFTGELQLSEFPILGSWKIDVSVDGTKESKNFEVDKYVLPKFEVQVEAPKDFAIADRTIPVTIRSKYTYGKPVKGKAVVSVKPSYYYYGESEKLTAEKTIPIDGKGHVEFDLQSELNLDKDRYTPPLTILAVVEEELTGLKQNSTATVTLHREKYQIQGVDTPYTYNPGKPVTIKVVVKNLDGSPVQDPKNPVTLTVSPPDPWIRPIPIISGPLARNDKAESTEPPQKDNVITLTSKLDKDGTAQFDVTIPDTSELSSTYYSVKASYLDSTSYVTSLSKFQANPTPVDDSLKITVQTKNPKLGKDVSLKLSSPDPIPYFVYSIVGRGDIIQSDIIEVPDKRNYHVFKITPSFEMVPRSTIFIYFIVNGDLKYTETSIQFDQDFENSISLDVPPQAKPGEDIKLKVSTDPNSFVGLLGVDQSVLLLKSGNDLSKDQIFSGLSRYESRTPWSYGYGEYPGTQAGAVIMTNANFPFFQTLPEALPFGVVNDEPSYIVIEAQEGLAEISDDEKKTVERESEQKMPTIRRNFWPFINFAYRGPAFLPPGGAFLTQNVMVAGLGVGGGFGMMHDAQPARQAPVIRKEFPETWLVADVQDTNGNDITVNKKVPDTITSWVITGFSLNPNTGLALTDAPSKIRVFQPFFVSTNLPYSVKRGEVISIPVIIFNYMEKNLDADVTLDNSDGEFEFAEATNEVTESTSDDVKRTKTLTIPSNNGQSVSFLIRPKKVGSITLKITAISPLAGDTVHQSLKVEPEGVTTFVNKALFINLVKSNEMKTTVDVDIPANAVPDSEYVTLAVVGDILGPTIENLDKLVNVPSGCGEQNMVNFVPNILVLKYLTTVNKLTPAIEDKAKRYLEIGYQRELQYKHDDGSYSAFGKSDKSGSTWLTAYVVKSFHQAIPYTNIDPNILEAGLKFLAGTQVPSGEFPEVGKVIDSSHDGGKIGLTAFVLLAFLENTETIPKYQTNIDKGLDFLEKELASTDDQYSLSISFLALALGNRFKSAEKIGDKLEALAKTDGDRQWWSKTVDSKKSWYGPRAVDVEMTSYYVITVLLKNQAADVLPNIKWLISQRNQQGGFSSTQDTVVGLQALIKFAEKSGSGTANLVVDFTDGKDASGQISVTPETSLVLQTHILPKTVKQVQVSAKGNGSALAQVSYRYNIAEKSDKPQFTVTPTVKESPKDQLVLEICTEYVPLENEKESNMAVMEVSLPSGYTADTDSFGRIEEVDKVKRVETKNSDSTVIVYFDNLDQEKRCVPIDAIKTHAVAKQKPAPVVVFDYYDNNKRATNYYQVKSSLCDICVGSDCGPGCANKN